MGIALPGPAAVFLAATLSLYGATIAVGFGVWWAPVLIALVIGAQGWWLQQFGVSSPWMVVAAAEIIVAVGLARDRS